LQDEALGGTQQVFKIARSSGEAFVKLLKRFFFGMVHEQAVQSVQEAVAGGSFDRPGGAQRLIADQDFFRHDVERPLGAGTLGCAVAVAIAFGQAAVGFGGILQIAKIFFRFVQTVGMVHAKPGDVSRAYQFKNEGVDGRENFGILHANGSQLIDVEKPAVVDFVGGHAPEAEAIGFALEQPFQAIETAGIAALAIQTHERFLDGLGRFGTGGD
jgi:hypothetical protein